MAAEGGKGGREGKVEGAGHQVSIGASPRKPSQNGQNRSKKKRGPERQKRNSSGRGLQVHSARGGNPA